MIRLVASLCVTASLALVTLIPATAQITAVPNSMNFQGRLAKPNGTPVVDGTYSVRFSLWTIAAGGTAAVNEKWNQTVSSVAVRNGVFAVTLSGFPANTFNSNLWLEIKIGTNAALTPRQPLLSVAYALKADSVKDGSITSASIAAGSLTTANFPPTFLNSTAWLLGGNATTNPATQFLGTTDNLPFNLRVNNRRAMRISYVENIASAFRTFNLLGGADSNSIGANVVGATIAGGGNAGINSTDLPNIVNSNYGFLGGGYFNLIDTNAVNSVIGGGFQNNINPGASNAAIVGGENNIINNNAAYAFIGGGQSNTASGANGVVGGGVQNRANGANAVAVGGNNNLASAQYSAVLGGNGNGASGISAFIGGGSSNQATRPESTVGGGKLNLATGDQTTIGGGESNAASAAYATVAGGIRNKALLNSATIGGGADNQATGPISFIGGGLSNVAGGRSSVVVGGTSNGADGESAVVGGGYFNFAHGLYSTVPGGYANYATGAGSFAAGTLAKSNFDGAFVWADYHTQEFFATANNQFCIRAYGGMMLETGADAFLYTSSTVGEKNRFMMFLNSPQTSSASGVKAGGILCSDSYDYANPGKNNMVVKGNLAVGYPSAAPYVAAFNGNVYALGSYAGSDARYKRNIVPLTRALDSILNLRGVSYEWDKAKFPNQSFGDGEQIGFIAQEIERVFPNLVITAPDGYKAVNYMGVIPVLVEAVKTQQKGIEALKSENEAIKAKNAELEAKLKELDAIKARLTAIETVLTKK